jgi:hypothetical protein
LIPLFIRPFLELEAWLPLTHKQDDGRARYNTV